MTEQGPLRSEESLRHEYSEITQNIRHYSNLRFAIFTIFFAVMGGVGFVAFSAGQFDVHAALVARFSGFPVIALFWLYQERAGLRDAHYQRVALQLERALNYTQYTSFGTSQRFPPKAGSTNRVFFAILTIAWLYAIFTVPL